MADDARDEAKLVRWSQNLLPDLTDKCEFHYREIPLTAVRLEDGFKVHTIVLDLYPFPWVDDTFRGYHFTPFPKLYAVERKVRRLATEGRERATGAWKVLRGDRDPFDMGDEW